MWFPVGPLGLPVSRRCRGIGSSIVPEAYGYVSVQSPIEQTLLQSSFSSVAALHFRAPQRPTWVSALFLTSLRSSHFAKRSTAFVGAVLGDLNRSTVFCDVACELVSSRSQVQDSDSFRGLSTPCSLQPSSDWFRPCRSASARSPASRLPRTGTSTPTFCSTRSRWPLVRCLASPGVAPLFEFSCSPRFISRQRRQFPACERSCRFARESWSCSEERLRQPHTRDSSAFPTSDLVAPSPKRPTCPSFSGLPHLLVKEPGTQRPNRSRLATPSSRTDRSHPKTPAGQT